MKKLLALAVLLPILSLAQIPKPLSNTYVNDFAGVLSPTQIQNLNVQIQNIEHGYSVQIAVLLIDKLPEGIDIEDYARMVGREWHVGNAKNGLVYVASIQEHKQRMEVAQNLEGSISDIVSSELTNDIKSYFRKKRECYGSLIIRNIIEFKSYEDYTLFWTGHKSTPAVGKKEDCCKLRFSDLSWDTTANHIIVEPVN